MSSAKTLRDAPRNPGCLLCAFAACIIRPLGHAEARMLPLYQNLKVSFSHDGDATL
jgi:hypothetical protein